MKNETARAHECVEDNRTTLVVETKKPPYSTLTRYYNEVDYLELDDPRLEPLIRHLARAKCACLSGQELYDMADRDALIRLNRHANMVNDLPEKVCLK